MVLGRGAGQKGRCLSIVDCGGQTGGWIDAVIDQAQAVGCVFTCFTNAFVTGRAGHGESCLNCWGQVGGWIDAVNGPAIGCLFTCLTSPFVAEVSDAVCHCFNAECEHTGTVCHASMLSAKE